MIALVRMGALLALIGVAGCSGLPDREQPNFAASAASVDHGSYGRQAEATMINAAIACTRDELAKLRVNGEPLVLKVATASFTDGAESRKGDGRGPHLSQKFGGLVHHYNWAVGVNAVDMQPDTVDGGNVWQVMTTNGGGVAHAPAQPDFVITGEIISFEQVETGGATFSAVVGGNVNYSLLELTVVFRLNALEGETVASARVKRVVRAYEWGGRLYVFDDVLPDRAVSAEFGSLESEGPNQVLDYVAAAGVVQLYAHIADGVREHCAPGISLPGERVVTNPNGIRVLNEKLARQAPPPRAQQPSDESDSARVPAAKPLAVEVERRHRS